MEVIYCLLLTYSISKEQLSLLARSFWSSLWSICAENGCFFTVESYIFYGSCFFILSFVFCLVTVFVVSIIEFKVELSWLFSLSYPPLRCTFPLCYVCWNWFFISPSYAPPPQIQQESILSNSCRMNSFLGEGSLIVLLLTSLLYS